MLLEDLSKTELTFLIDEWVHHERDRAILKRILLDGIIYDRLAEEIELSVRHVKQIVY